MPTHSGFVWDPTANQYRDARGRFVSRVQVRVGIDRALQAAQREVVALGRQLQRREITLQAWELAMRRATKDLHLYSAAAARGGWGQLSPTDFGRVGRVMRDQYRYLANFSKQLEAGLPKDGRFTRRVELYAQAGRTIYEQTHQQTMREAGMNEVRSVLNPAVHCRSCIEEADKGWGPIGHVRPIGTRDCLSRCHCTLEFRKVG